MKILNHNTSKNLPHLVIIGGGFGGLTLAKSLKNTPIQLTLVDRKNHHLFQPLLYQVASAVLSPGDIAVPIRWVLRKQANTKVLLAEVNSIDIANKQIKFVNQTLKYDMLTVAAGVRNDYFGNKDWNKHAPGLKSVDDALELRERILMAYELAEWSTNPEEQRKNLTFVVVGGGATGVEMAGALAEIARQTLLKDFRNIDSSDANVILIEGSNKLLNGFREPLPEKARNQLESIGVEVITNKQVTKIDENGVVFGEKRINASTVFWAAGVRASFLVNELDTPKDWMGRIIVEPDCSIPNHPEVFVIGDLANHQHAKEEKDSPPDNPLPGVAQTAIQMGNHVAKCINADLAGRMRPRFIYKNLGNMATVGRSKAVADIFGIRFAGMLAWFIWLFVHLMSIVGFRNRLIVLIQWFWSYLSLQRGARLIYGKNRTNSLNYHRKGNNGNRSL